MKLNASILISLCLLAVFAVVCVASIAPSSSTEEKLEFNDLEQPKQWNTQLLRGDPYDTPGGGG